ncbi:MAG: methylmalonyl-CoA epimerase [Anaerolineae bacterium]|nr:methylmalonyl-CoA epimerase [Anaerolineae bacterium]
MKTTRINHLGIAVQDVQAAAAVYEAMGLSVDRVIEVPEQKVRVAFIPIGESTIELLQPTSPDSTVAQYLETRGEGLHHLALEVEDIEAALTELDRQGYRLIDRTPRRGAEGRIAFLHPRSTGRVLIELVEPESQED